MMGYTVVGEMGFYRQVPRTATVIAEEPSVVYRLTRDCVRQDAGARPDRGLGVPQADHQAACPTGSNSPIARSRRCSRLVAAYTANAMSTPTISEIGQAVHELVGAEREPEAAVLRRPAVAAGDLLFQPIDVIVEHEFAHGDAEHEQERGRRDHEIDERRQRDMDGAVQDARQDGRNGPCSCIDRCSADRNRRPHA